MGTSYSLYIDNPHNKEEVLDALDKAQFERVDKDIKLFFQYIYNFVFESQLLVLKNFQMEDINLNYEQMKNKTIILLSNKKDLKTKFIKFAKLQTISQCVIESLDSCKIFSSVLEEISDSPIGMKYSPKYIYRNFFPLFRFRHGYGIIINSCFMNYLKICNQNIVSEIEPVKSNKKKIIPYYTIEACTDNKRPSVNSRSGYVNSIKDLTDIAAYYLIDNDAKTCYGYNEDFYDNRGGYMNNKGYTIYYFKNKKWKIYDFENKRVQKILKNY